MPFEDRSKHKWSESIWVTNNIQIEEGISVWSHYDWNANYICQIEDNGGKNGMWHEAKMHSKLRITSGSTDGAKECSFVSAEVCTLHKDVIAYRFSTLPQPLEYFCVAFAAFINCVIRIQWHGANAFIRDMHALILRNGARSTCKLYTKCKTMRYGYPASGFRLGVRKRHCRNKKLNRISRPFSFRFVSFRIAVVALLPRCWRHVPYKLWVILPALTRRRRRRKENISNGFLLYSSVPTWYTLNNNA